MTNLLGDQSTVDLTGGKLRHATAEDALFLAACKNTASDGSYMPIWGSLAEGARLIASSSGPNSYKHAVIVEDNEGNKRYGFFYQSPDTFGNPPARTGDSTLDDVMSAIYSVSLRSDVCANGEQTGSLYLSSFASVEHFAENSETRPFLRQSNWPDFTLPTKEIHRKLYNYVKNKDYATMWALVDTKKRDVKALWSRVGLKPTGSAIVINPSLSMISHVQKIRNDKTGHSSNSRSKL